MNVFKKIVYIALLWGLLLLTAEGGFRLYEFVTGLSPSKVSYHTREQRRGRRSALYGREEVVPHPTLGTAQNILASQQISHSRCGEEVVWTPPPDPHITKFPRLPGKKPSFSLAIRTPMPCRSPPARPTTITLRNASATAIPCTPPA